MDKIRVEKYRPKTIAEIKKKLTFHGYLHIVIGVSLIGIGITLTAKGITIGTGDYSPHMLFFSLFVSGLAVACVGYSFLEDSFYEEKINEEDLGGSDNRSGGTD